jgi:hypothetical protein
VYDPLFAITWIIDFFSQSQKNLHQIYHRIILDQGHQKILASTDYASWQDLRVAMSKDKLYANFHKHEAFPIAVLNRESIRLLYRSDN